MEKNKMNQGSSGQTKPKVVVVGKDQKSADSIKKPAQSSRLKKKEEKWDFPYVKKNFIIAGIGLIVIIAGYLLMSTGITEEPALTEGGKWNNPMAVTIAPILLIIGYCVIIPYALYKFFGKKEESEI